MGATLTSFDLEGLDSELRPLAVWLIGDYTWKLAKRDRRRRILCMDEVKTLLEYPESARLVAHLYTLGRAYNLSVWSATQLLSDYTSTPEGGAGLAVRGHGAAPEAGGRQGRGGRPGAVRVVRRGSDVPGGGAPRARHPPHPPPSPWELELMGGPSTGVVVGRSPATLAS